MNIQMFKDKIKALLDEKEALVNLAINETRELSEDEYTRSSKIDNEIESLEYTIKKIEARGAARVEEPKVEDKVEEVVEPTDEEIIALVEAYITDTRTLKEVAEDEFRAGSTNLKFPSAANKLNKTSDLGIIIPKKLSEFILKKMEEHSQVFAESTKYSSVNGIFQVVTDEDAISGKSARAFRVAEGKAFDDWSKLNFGHIDFDQNRYVAGYVLTQHLINNSFYDLVPHCLDKLAERMARQFEYEIFNNQNTTNNLKLNDLGQGFRSLKTKDKGGSTHLFDEVSLHYDESLQDFFALGKDLNRMVTGLHPNFLPKAKWYMSRAMYQHIALITERGLEDNEFLLQNNVVNGKLGMTLYGFPIVITQEMDPEEVYFGDIGATFAVMIKKDMELRHIYGDTTNAIAGTHSIMLDVYADGSVVNTQSMIFGKKTSRP